MHLVTKRGSHANDVVEYLVREGANVNTRNYRGVSE